MGIALIDMKMDREFKKRNTVKGTAKKAETLARLGVTVVEPKAPGYKVIDGVPHKYKNGNYVPLTKKV